MAHFSLLQIWMRGPLSDMALRWLCVQPVIRLLGERVFVEFEVVSGSEPAPEIKRLGGWSSEMEIEERRRELQ